MSEPSTSELVAETCAQQRAAWSAGQRIPVETFLAQHPALRDDTDTMLDVIYNEIVLREELGETSTLTEFRARFPELTEPLKQLFAVHQVVASDSSATADSDAVPAASTPDVDRDRPHTIGGYEILEEVGRGGMGIVYRARQPGTGREVALKVILAGKFASSDEIKRFQTEAQAAAKLEHPGIVPIYDAGQADDVYFLSMAFINGETLAELLAQGPLSGRRAAEIIAEAAEGLAAAHLRNVIHRDLKPHNILIDDEGCVRITDFGLARNVERAGSLTTTGQIVGTPQYMPPEQALGRHDQVGPASDVYALGATLYCALVGRPPFDGAVAVEVLQRAALDEPVAPRILVPAVPRDLETICQKCLEKDPQNRYASGRELAEDLRRALRGETILARPIGWPGRLLRWCRRRPLVASLTLAVALLSVMLLVGLSASTILLRNEQRATAALLRDTSEANVKLVEANRLADARTVEALLAQAGRARLSGRAGRRFEGIAAVDKASSILKDLPPDEPTMLKLRNELLACVSLPDLRKEARWEGYRKGSDQTGIAVSPDSERYARFMPNGALSIRRLRDNSEERSISDVGYAEGLSPSPSPRFFLRFSPDGSMIASVGQNANGRHAEIPTTIWNVATGESLLSVPAEGYWCTDDVDFSADSNRVAIGFSDGNVRLFSLPDGVEIATLEPTDNRTMPTIIRFSPAGDLLAVARSNGLEVWNTTQRKVVNSFSHEAEIRSLAWHPTADEVACVHLDRDGLRIYPARSDVAKPRTVFALVPMIHAAFHPDGRTVAIVGARTTSLFDLKSEQKLFDVDGLAIGFSQDGRFLSFGFAGSRIGRWQYSSAPECRSFVCNDAATDRVGLSFSRDNLLAVCCNDSMRLVDPDNAREVAAIPVASAVLGQFLTKDDTLVTVSESVAERRTVKWSPSHGTPEIGAPTVLAQADSSRLTFGIIGVEEDEMLVCRESGLSHIVALSDPSQAQEMRFDPFWTMAVAPDRRWALTTYWHYKTLLWDANTMSLVREFDGVRSRAEFSRDGRWLVVGGSQDYHIYSVGDWAEACYIDREFPGQGLGAMTFTRDSRLLAVAGSLNSIRLFHTSDWSEAVTFTMPVSSPAYFLTFSPDHRYLAACTNEGMVCIWNLRLLTEQLAKRDLDWPLAVE